MINFLWKILLVYLLSISSSFSEIINKVEVSGNKRISKETIIVIGKIKKDINYDNKNLNDVLKNLYETNFFKDIDIDLSNNVMTINVKENPIIEDIEIAGIKSKDFLEAISEETILKNRMSFTESLLEKDINLIKNILKANGFYFANVESSLIKNNELNSVRLKLNIDKGKRARIKEISFYRK